MTKLTDDELNNRIHEILELCFHRWKYEYKNDLYQCLSECKQLRKEPADIDFITSWQGFGLMFEFMQKHERWEEFLWEQDGDNCCLPVSLISPRLFAEAMCEFFGREK